MNDNRNTRFNSFVAVAGLVCGILLIPFLFEKIFAVGLLRDVERSRLFVFSMILIALSATCWLRRKKTQTGLSMSLLVFLLFAIPELAVRLSVKAFASDDTKLRLAFECNWTYTDSSAYKGHPFIQFTGRPTIKLKGTDAHHAISPFNNFGFVGNDFHYAKNPGVIRIACLGESTTEDGYPALLEHYLDSVTKKQYEVMNFGHAYWTTNHSLANFVLNVQDFHPDFIVIHHGWNEERVRHVLPSEFRSDYSHAFKVFEEPSIPDRYIIRLSVIYRWIRFKVDPDPAWTSLSSYIHPSKKVIDNGYTNLDELKPYRRNLENMIQLALFRHIGVVLTTLPHSTDPNIALYYMKPSIDQCNAVTREVAAAFRDKIAFVDLDSLITGKHNEIFKDLGHVTDQGRMLKSQAIGNALLDSTRNQTKAGP